jgi:hypothetical protein
MNPTGSRRTKREPFDEHASDTTRATTYVGRERVRIVLTTRRGPRLRIEPPASLVVVIVDALRTFDRPLVIEDDDGL